MSWSGIQCAYARRGDHGRAILVECREKIEKLLKEYFPATDPDLQAIEAYLYYMKGLTFGLDVADKGTGRRNPQTLIDEQKAYEKAMESLVNTSDAVDWVKECRVAIEARKRRVGQMQA